MIYYAWLLQVCMRYDPVGIGRAGLEEDLKAVL